MCNVSLVSESVNSPFLHPMRHNVAHIMSVFIVYILTLVFPSGILNIFLIFFLFHMQIDPYPRSVESSPARDGTLPPFFTLNTQGFVVLGSVQNATLWPAAT